jgi:uncharacterized membrane protein
VWHRKDEACEEKCIVPTVKHGGGSIMIWGYFAASGTEKRHIIDGTMNAAMYQKILPKNVLPGANKDKTLCCNRITILNILPRKPRNFSENAK